MRHTVAFFAIAFAAMLVLNSAYCVTLPIKALGTYGKGLFDIYSNDVEQNNALLERDKAALLNLKSKGIDTFLLRGAISM